MTFNDLKVGVLFKWYKNGRVYIKSWALGASALEGREQGQVRVFICRKVYPVKKFTVVSK